MPQNNGRDRRAERKAEAEARQIARSERTDLEQMQVIAARGFPNSREYQRLAKNISGDE